jgi:hypothetical protein
MSISIADFFEAVDTRQAPPDPEMDARIQGIRELFEIAKVTKHLARLELPATDATPPALTAVTKSMGGMSLEIKCGRCHAVFALRKTLKMHSRVCSID